MQSDLCLLCIAMFRIWILNTPFPFSNWSPLRLAEEMATALSDSDSTVSAVALRAAIFPTFTKANPWNAVFEQASPPVWGLPGSGVWSLREWQRGGDPPQNVLSGAVQRVSKGIKYQSLTEKLQLEAAGERPWSLSILVFVYFAKG